MLPKSQVASNRNHGNTLHDLWNVLKCSCCQTETESRCITCHRHHLVCKFVTAWIKLTSVVNSMDAICPSLQTTAIPVQLLDSAQYFQILCSNKTTVSGSDGFKHMFCRNPLPLKLQRLVPKHTVWNRCAKQLAVFCFVGCHFAPIKFWCLVLICKQYNESRNILSAKPELLDKSVLMFEIHLVGEIRHQPLKCVNRKCELWKLDSDQNLHCDVPTHVLC